MVENCLRCGAKLPKTDIWGLGFVIETVNGVLFRVCRKCEDEHIEMTKKFSEEERKWYEMENTNGMDKLS